MYMSCSSIMLLCVCIYQEMISRGGGGGGGDPDVQRTTCTLVFVKVFSPHIHAVCTQ